MKNQLAYITICLALFSCTKVAEKYDSIIITPNGKAQINITQTSKNSNTNIIISPSDANVFVHLGQLYTCKYNSISSGSTTIKLQSQTTGQILQSTSYTIGDDYKNSVFVYPYGTSYRNSYVRDDYSLSDNYAAVRLINLSTSLANNSFDYTITSGYNSYNFKQRTFLDHEFITDNAKFISVLPGSYTLYATSGNTLIINPYAFTLLKGSAYTIIVTNITVSDLQSFSMPHN